MIDLSRIKRGVLKPLLLVPWIGAPLSLAFRIAAAVAARAQRSLARIHGKLPYTRVLAAAGFKSHIRPILRYYKFLREHIPTLPLQPKISVLIPVYKVDLRHFSETIGSVRLQTYENWEICAVDDGSGSAEIAAAFRDYETALGPDRFKYALSETNEHISATSNKCLALASGDYCALLDHDDRLYPNALAEVVRHINLHGGPDILYSDERTCTGDGAPLNVPFFKPAWSPFFHLSVNYTTHLSTYRTGLLREIGGFRKGFEGSQDHDLMLRAVEATRKPVVHIPLVLYQWRAHEGSTAFSIDTKPYAAIAGEKAVAEHIARRGRAGKVSFEPQTLHYRVAFDLPSPPPKISILIPTRDRADLLKACVDSIFSLSTYPDFEVLVIDNASQEPQTQTLLEGYAGAHPERFRTLRDEGPFNFARLNNRAVREARGTYVVLLNNDVEVRTPEWLEEMLRLAQFEEVGAVGAKLLYPNGSIQHAGVVLIGDGIAYHEGQGLSSRDNLYCQVLNTVHECAAVTAACLMTAREKYLAAGGLDETWLPNGYGDVDFCLNLRKRGLSILYTPYAELLHRESQSREAAVEAFEMQRMREKWGHELINDPYLNPNLRRTAYFEAGPESLRFELDAKTFASFLEARKVPEP